MIDLVLSINALYNIGHQIGTPFNTNLGITVGAIDQPQTTPHSVSLQNDDDTLVKCRTCHKTILIHPDEATDIAQYSSLQGCTPELKCYCGHYIPLPL